jgi:hypothetical protein
MVMTNLQHIVSIFVNSDTNRKSNKDRWCSVANCKVEAHRSMVDVTHFSQHSVEMNAVDSCPCKS